MTDKIVIIVDPVSSGLNLRKAVRRLGFQVGCILTIPERVLLAELKPLTMSRQEMEQQFDYFHDARDMPIENIPNELGSSNLKIVGVIPGSERGAEISDSIAKQLGLPHNDPALVSTRRNKAAMKEAARNVGLRCPRFSRCHNISDLTHNIQTFEYPIIVKAPEGAATHNVFKCGNLDEAKVAHHRIISAPDYWGKTPQYSVIEEFIPGIEYVVNGIVDGRNFYLSDAWRVEKRSNKFADNLYYVSYLERFPSLARDQLAKFVSTLVPAIGVKIGPIHAEIKVDDQGPALIEIGARLSGARAPEFVSEYSNFDPYEATVRVYINETIEVPVPIICDKYLAISHCASLWCGEIKKVFGIERIRTLSSHVWDDFDSFEYGSVRPTIDMSNYPLNVWLANENLNELRVDAVVVHDLFRIEIE